MKTNNEIKRFIIDVVNAIILTFLLKSFNSQDVPADISNTPIIGTINNKSNIIFFFIYLNFPQDQTKLIKINHCIIFTNTKQICIVYQHHIIINNLYLMHLHIILAIKIFSSFKCFFHLVTVCFIKHRFTRTPFIFYVGRSLSIIAAIVLLRGGKEFFRVLNSASVLIRAYVTPGLEGKLLIFTLNANCARTFLAYKPDNFYLPSVSCSNNTLLNTVPLYSCVGS